MRVAPYLGATLHFLKRKFMGQINSPLNVGMLLPPWLGIAWSILVNAASQGSAYPQLEIAEGAKAG